MLIKRKIVDYLSKYGNEHILIHSDVVFGFEIKFTNKFHVLEQHIQELKDICGPLNIIMPTFNYDFLKGSPYNVNNDKSHVGVLSNHFLKYANWRTAVPVFNFAGTGENPLTSQYYTIDPFDEESVFGFLHRQEGLLMHYGSGLHTTTLLHYVERVSGNLIYRYDKEFCGQVFDSNSNNHLVKLCYHVRPMGLPLIYNWPKIESDLKKNQLINIYQENTSKIILGRIEKIVSFWLSCINDNPFYFLNIETENWVKKKYNKLNRPFMISDFE